jgi:dihydrodipicolinate synthase/N-acetylneuraminate lyase
MPAIQGICPIIATPFTPAGQVDEDSMRHLIRALAHGGCHALTLFGIAGEYYKLSDAEHARMIALVVEECRAANVPSIISVTQHATELAVAQARATEAAGADCLMLLPPFFLKPSAADLYRHMKAVGEAVRVPIMVQYAPEQTGVGIDAAIFERLGREVPTIVYYRIECRPPGPYISRLLALTEGRAQIFNGNAGFQMLETFDRGAIGSMPGCSMYDVYLAIYERYTVGDRVSAAALHAALLPMLNHIRQDVEMIIAYEKRILKRRGLIEHDSCRTPTFTADAYFDRIFDELYEQLSPHFAAQPALATP